MFLLIPLNNSYYNKVALAESKYLTIYELPELSHPGGGGVLWEFLGGDVPLGPWSP